MPHEFTVQKDLDKILSTKIAPSPEELSNIFSQLRNLSLLKSPTFYVIRSYLFRLIKEVPQFFLWPDSYGNPWAHDLIKKSSTLDAQEFKWLLIIAFQKKDVIANIIVSVENQEGLDIFNLMCQRDIMQYNTALSTHAHYIIGVLAEHGYTFCCLFNGRFLDFVLNPFHIKDDEYYHLLPDIWKYISIQTRNQLDSTGHTMFYHLVKNKKTWQSAQKLLDMAIEKHVLFDPALCGTGTKSPLQIYEEVKEDLENNGDWYQEDEEEFDDIPEKIETVIEKTEPSKVRNNFIIALYLMAVCIEDGYFTIKNSSQHDNKIQFFNILLRLPDDLKQIMAHRTLKSAGERISKIQVVDFFNEAKELINQNKEKPSDPLEVLSFIYPT